LGGGAVVTEKGETPKIKPKRGMSVAIFPMSLGGANGAKLELDAIFVPPYNAGKYGISLTFSPKQADIIFLYGIGTQKTLEHALELLKSLPDEVKLVALGSDAPTAANAREKGYTVRGLAVDYRGTESVPTATEPASPNPENPSLDSNLENSSSIFLALPEGKKIAAYLTGAPPEPQSIINLILELA
jgi:Ni,Fe-hydrogenase III small subunit